MTKEANLIGKIFILFAKNKTKLYSSQVATVCIDLCIRELLIILYLYQLYTNGTALNNIFIIFST